MITKHFARHYLAMLVAMAAGMLVLGAAVRLVAEIPPSVAPLEMTIDMSVGMLVRMRLRRHGRAATAEMIGAMFVPLAVLYPLFWAGALDADALMVLEHLLMLPLMFVVMLRRRGEYAHG